jgi:hypothetical protein
VTSDDEEMKKDSEELHASGATRNTIKPLFVFHGQTNGQLAVADVTHEPTKFRHESPI